MEEERKSRIQTEDVFEVNEMEETEEDLLISEEAKQSLKQDEEDTRIFNTWLSLREYTEQVGLPHIFGATSVNFSKWIEERRVNATKLKNK